jgi:hypothetical protein
MKPAEEAGNGSSSWGEEETLATFYRRPERWSAKLRLTAILSFAGIASDPNDLNCIIFRTNFRSLKSSSQDLRSPFLLSRRFALYPTASLLL